MSFWDKAFKVAKDVGTSVVSSIEESANEARELKKKYEEMEDEELIRVVHSEGFFGKSSKEKGAAFGVLRRRGHSVEDINSQK